MIFEHRSVRQTRSPARYGTAGDAVLQRPGRFVNAPAALAPVRHPPDGPESDLKRRRRDDHERPPLRQPQRPRPATPTRN